MNSCCRTAALRIFVRNITQVHFPPPTSAYHIPRYHSTLTPLSTLQRTGVAFGGARGRLLHTSSVEGGEDGAWPPPGGLPAHQEPSPPQVVFEAADEIGSEQTEGAIDAGTSPQHDSTGVQEPGEAQPKLLGKWAWKKQKKAQEAAAKKVDGEGERSVPENPENNTTVVMEKGNDKNTPNTAPDAQPAKKRDKLETERPKPPKREGKGAKFKRLKKEREERRRKKLEILGSGEQEGTVSMGKAELKRALQEKKLREEREQERAKAKAMEQEAALAQKLERKAELKAARKERRRREFEEQEEAKMKAEEKGELEEWMVQKKALKEKFPEGWMPRKRLSPDALVGIRALNSQFPEQYTTAKLSKKFQVSPEAIRRILRSRWTPDVEEEEGRQGRWFNRGKRVWAHWAELGKKPPAKWRAEGVVRDPKWNRGRKKQKPLMGDFLG